MPILAEGLEAGMLRAMRRRRCLAMSDLHSLHRLAVHERLTSGSRLKDRRQCRQGALLQ